MVEYAYYAESYHGKEISEDDWGGKARFAAAYINLNFAGYDEAGEDYKSAICAVAEAKQKTERGVLASQTVGSWSKHYSVQTVSDKERLMEAAMLYLSEFAKRGVDWA